MLIGYARVSKTDGSQSLDLQRDALRAAGVDDAVNRYHDFASGIRDDRPGLDSCLRARGPARAPPSDPAARRGLEPFGNDRLGLAAVAATSWPAAGGEDGGEVRRTPRPPRSRCSPEPGPGRGAQRGRPRVASSSGRAVEARRRRAVGGGRLSSAAAVRVGARGSTATSGAQRPDGVGHAGGIRRRARLRDVVQSAITQNKRSRGCHHSRAHAIGIRN